jgi:hypothetical protein
MFGAHRFATKRNELHKLLEALSAPTFGSAQFAPSLRTASEVAATMSDSDERASSIARHPTAQASVRAVA